MKGLGVIKHFSLLIITASLMVKLSLHSDNDIYILTVKLFSVKHNSDWRQHCMPHFCIFFQIPA